MEKINNKSIRFRDASWFTPNLDIIIAGLGGIGSFCSFLLGRQEANLHLFDMDNYDETNLSGQMVRVSDIGLSKEQVSVNIAREFSGNNNVRTYGKYTKDSFAAPIMFSCFDNMEARKIMFGNWSDMVMDSNFKELYPIYIDGRLIAEAGQIYFVTPDRIEEYKSTLFDDNEVELVPCSYKSTSFCSTLIASLMVSGFNNYISNCKSENPTRELAFKIDYNLPLMNFDIL